jgi:hypothetical protein
MRVSGGVEDGRELGEGIEEVRSGVAAVHEALASGALLGPTAVGEDGTGAEAGGEAEAEESGPEQDEPEHERGLRGGRWWAPTRSDAETGDPRRMKRPPEAVCDREA